MRRALYPWLLCIHPIAYLYAQNLGIVHDGEVLVAALASLGATTLLYALLRVASGNPHKSALATAIAVIVFFSGGHVAALAESADGNLLAPLLVPGLLLAGALALSGVWKFVSDEHAGSLNLACNAVALFLLATPALAIAGHSWALVTREDGQIIAVGEKPQRAPKVLDGPEHPDVYFIIADGYSSNAQLLREYGFDNSAFTDALEGLGFTVVYDSQSAYGATMHSVSSTLNLRYVEKNTAGPGIRDMAYLHILLADSLVARLMIERGYTHLHLLSGALLPSSIADVNFNFGPRGVSRYSYLDLTPDLHKLDKRSIESGTFLKRSFHPFLAETTLLYRYSDEIRRLLDDPAAPYPWDDPRRFLDTLETVKDIAEKPEATFTFVHLLEPHGPTQVDRHGRRIPRRTWKPTAQQFFDELAFVNARLLDLLETVLERSSSPPIIVLQADHGSTLGRIWTDEMSLTNFEILNAVYVPDPARLALAPDESPINTWRMLLNAYFGGNYERLEVRHFDVPKGYEAPFEQVEVTGRVR